jgi:hypothetical protein
MAVINPVHEGAADAYSIPDVKIGITGSPVRYQLKDPYQKMLPDHLIRPPPELLKNPTQKEKTAEDIVRLKEAKEGRKLSSKETRSIFESVRKKEENRKKLEVIKKNSKTFFKACQLRLEEINARGETPKKSKIAKSVIGELFSTKLKGVRKLYNDVMGTKPEKISKTKFLEFAKQVLKSEKLTVTETKDLYNFLCHKNKRKETDATTTKNKTARVFNHSNA